MADVTLADLQDWVTRFGALIDEHEAELTELDSAIGDADHGANMSRGLHAALSALASTPPASPADLGRTVGMALVSNVGGASGPLYGTFFLRLGTAAAQDDPLSAAQLGAALRAGTDGIVARGKAALGDKTMLDALLPAMDAWDSAVDGGARAAAEAALAAAQAGRDATIPLVARKGRASYLGERSAGHLDPGAASATLLLEALRDALAASAS